MEHKEKMRAYVIEHAPARALGVKETIQAMSPDVEVFVVQAYLGQALPKVDDCDVIISGGGPMGVYEIHNPDYEFILREADFLRDAIDSGKAVLGICFGHQLLAHVMGGDVVRDEGHKEIGWSKISLLETGMDDPLFQNVDPEFSSFQYHYDQVIKLPDGAIRLAESDLTPIQAVRYAGQPLYGVQFHPEISPEIAEKILSSRADKLKEMGIDVFLMIEKSKQENKTNRELIFYNFLQLLK